MRSPKAPRLVTVAIITTATIIFWIFFEVYRIFTTPAPAEVPEELLRPINPTLNEQALQKIQERTFFEESEIPENPIVPSAPDVIEEAEPTPTEVPSTPIEISPTPTATESAEIESP